MLKKIKKYVLKVEKNYIKITVVLSGILYPSGGTVHTNENYSKSQPY